MGERPGPGQRPHQGEMDGVRAATAVMVDEGCHVVPPSVLPDISPSWGESALSLRVSTNARVAVWRNQNDRPISPLEGEMSGRTEGGVKGHPPCRRSPTSMPPPSP